MTIEILKKINVGVPIQDNIFWKIMAKRIEITTTPTTPINDTEIKIISIDRTLIIKGDPNILDYSAEDRDGKTYISYPFSEEKIFIISKGDVIVFFSNSNENCEPFLPEIIKEIVSKQFTGRTINYDELDTSIVILDDTKEPIGGADPNVPIPLNIPEKKIMATFDINKNHTGYIEFCHVVFDYDTISFNEYSNPINNNDENLKTLKISGIKNEGSDYTNNQFIIDVIEALKIKFKEIYPEQIIIIEGE